MKRLGTRKLERRAVLKLGSAATAGALIASHAGVALAKGKGQGGGGLPTTSGALNLKPFIQPLVIPQIAAPVESLSPAPLEDVNSDGGERGRNRKHQRWSEFEPQKLYDIHVREFEHSFHPDLPKARLWGFDSMFPGPTFVSHYGEPELVRIHNELPDPANHTGFGDPNISTHLHNLHTASESDGNPEDYYAPGFFKDHHYPMCCAGYDTSQELGSSYPGDAREALGTLFYHDHRPGFTAPNVYRGLVGFRLMYDEIDSGNEADSHPEALRLPSGKYDVALALHDPLIDSAGQLIFPQLNFDGVLGNTFAINGKIQPYFDVDARKYRLRLLACPPSRVNQLCLARMDATGRFRSLGFDYYISNDGNLLPAPILKKSEILLGPAERADVVVDFSLYKGEKIFLVNVLQYSNGRGPGRVFTEQDLAIGKVISGIPVMQFRVGMDAVADPSRVGIPQPDGSLKLRELPPIDLREVVQVRKFKFDRCNGMWAINGLLYDNIAKANPKKGTAEIWELEVSGNWFHPIHIHFEEGRILERNGQPPAPYEAGRKDVYLMPPGHKIRIFMRFRDFVGRYVMHCHNTVHEDHDMMLRWDIVE
jgi:FtsP/CotA-like multicopper oxidase with cupredoxin domain